MSQINEHDCVERAGRGDPAAVAALYRTYWRAARAAAYGVTGDLSLAEDAASEAFAAAMGSLANLRDPERFGPWLRTIVVRTARRLKTASSTRHKTEPQPAPDAQTPGQRLEQQELAALIREAVGSLPAILREAVSLFYFEGYSVEEAARFLGVPVGTVKRRLHDGRRRLREAAQHIVAGDRPMNEQREHVLRQLGELIDKGGDSDAVYRVMREAMALRPVPHDLLRTLLRRETEARRAAAAPEEIAKREQFVRSHWDEMTRPSPRATDPQHPVGAAADAIRAALPEFEERPAAPIDFDTAMRRFRGQDEPASPPSEFTEGRPVSYWRISHGLLVQDEDGTVYGQHELFAKKTSRQDMEAAWQKGLRVSDVLTLWWLRPKPLELHDVESLLRRLVEAVIPGTPVAFSPTDAFQYRAALRMQIGDIPVPGAIGGLLEPRPGQPQEMEMANVQLYLESWATARSGQTIELAGSPFPLGG